MNIKLGDLSSVTILWMAGYSLFLSVVNIMSIVRAASMRVYRNIRIQSVCSVIVSLSLLWLTDVLYYYEEGHPDIKNEAVIICNRSVWWVVIAFIIATISYILVYMRNKVNILKSMIPFDLYEGVNQMTDGICFSNSNGVVLMVNKTMYRISQLAFNSKIFNSKYVIKRIINNDLCEGCSIERTKNSLFLHLSDGSVWDIRSGRFRLGRRVIDEYIFYDVTEKYCKRKELNVRYEHLNSINRHIRKYRNNIDRMVREQEILNAKIKIHNDVGRSLLALRRYLAEQFCDREKLVRLWEFTVDVLKKQAVSEDTGNRIEQLIKAGKAVGVDVIVHGKAGYSDTIERIIAISIHESITNTVKHGSGNKVYVNIENADEKIVVKITNNGTPPKPGFKEKGGLLNLRNSVEMVGGEMTIEFEPVFLIKLTLTYRKWEGTMNNG